MPSRRFLSVLGALLLPAIASGVVGRDTGGRRVVVRLGAQRRPG